MLRRSVAITGIERNNTIIANFKYLGAEMALMAEDRKAKMERFLREHKWFFKKLAKSI